MRTGKLSISRGHQLGEASGSMPRLSLVPREETGSGCAPVTVAQRTAPPASAPAAPVSPEYRIVHDRLAALERLARLRDAGALSAAEYEAEKAIVLGLPADELVLHAQAPETAAPAEAIDAQPPVRGPSLFGRLFGWHIVPIGLAVGLGASYASQPRETLRFFDEALRLLGA